MAILQKIIIIALSTFSVILFSCTQKNAGESGKSFSSDSAYTCPMPQDSFFSNKPGKCPKCGMELVKHEQHTQSAQATTEYTCPMHPQIISDKPGDCPICGMKLVKKDDTHTGSLKDVQLENLLKPTNGFVVSGLAVTSMQQKTEQLKIKALGSVAYNTESVGAIAARVEGRIEKLYVRYKFQYVTRGQKIMDIYSPELLTAQQNLLFLLKNDTENTDFIEAAKDKLLLLGMSKEQLQKVIASGKAAYTVSVYSNCNGHIHESGAAAMPSANTGAMKDINLTTEALSIKEGMYVSKGQTVFTVYNPAKAWALLNIYANDLSLLQKGAGVTVTPETAPDKAFKTVISFIEPFYRNTGKTLTARVNFDNSVLRIPIGSQVNAVIESSVSNANWLASDAIVSLGVEKAVFIKEDGGFRAHKIQTGVSSHGYTQVLSGLTMSDEVASNAQFLMDSESFIKVNQQ